MPRAPRGALSCLLTACLVTCVATVALAVPPNFVIENAVPDVTFNTPTALAFLPDGRMLVAEKSGRVVVVVNGVKLPTPMWSGEGEVLENGDRGLVGLAVDPEFATRPYIYLAYVADPDSDGNDHNNDVAFGRVVRYQISVLDSNVVDYGSRTILLGTTWADGVPNGLDSHTIDALEFGRDGSLFLSCGDGASYGLADAGGVYPNLFLPGRVDSSLDIGAFRAQDLDCYNGKLLRLDPLTGHGYPSNPYWNGDPDAPRSKVWAYGLRNPWRFTFRPGTGSTDPSAGDPGTIYIGDVGWVGWEEIDVATQGGRNFGWPCYEGIVPNADYQLVTPLEHGCLSFGTPDNPALPTFPVIAYSHTAPDSSVPPGLQGNSCIGGVFYSGTAYPPLYQNAYFFADYGPGWLKFATLDATDHLVQMQEFEWSVFGPVDFTTDPATGDITFISILTGQVMHILYTGGTTGNHPPVAIATASPEVGVLPLDVAFSGTQSVDPDSDALSYAWTFGDGQSASGDSPVHTYMLPGDYSPVLTVFDGNGGFARDTARVIVLGTSAFPLTPLLDDFNHENGLLGASWLGGAGMQVENNAVKNTVPASALFGETYGPIQEAWVTISSLGIIPFRDLVLLKGQGTSFSAGVIGVQYDSGTHRATVQTYTPRVGWEMHGAPIPVVIAAGNHLGGRAYPDGSVEVYKNSTKIGTVSVGSWPFAAAGGHIGMAMAIGTSRLDNFGGGNVPIGSNTAPATVLTSPIDSTFFVTGDTLHFIGSATDTQDPSDSLALRWEVDVHHNNHIHPNTFVANGPTANFVTANHDDGTGVHYLVRLVATDLDGASDTASVSVFPQVDLQPSAVSVSPPVLLVDSSATCTFAIRNLGGMPAPVSHWRLTAGPTMLAEGDVQVAAHDSVPFTVTVPPMLAPGLYALRIVADTLKAVVEPNEKNDAWTGLLAVTNLDVGATPVPLRLALSGAIPNPSHGSVALALDLPSAARVTFAIYDLSGRRLWQEPSRVMEAGRWTLAWPGRGVSGDPAAAGLYLARVTLDDGRVLVRRIVIVR